MPDLARLYVLCARIQALEPLKAAFRDYIGRTGLALVLDEEKVCSPLKSLMLLQYLQKPHWSTTSLQTAASSLEQTSFAKNCVQS